MTTHEGWREHLEILACRGLGASSPGKLISQEITRGTIREASRISHHTEISYNIKTCILLYMDMYMHVCLLGNIHVIILTCIEELELTVWN